MAPSATRRGAVSEGRVYIHNKLGSGDAGLGAAELAYYFGNPGDKPFTGDFDGDGIDTAGLFRPANAKFYFRNTNTQGIADGTLVWGDTDWLPVAGSFDLN